MTTSLDYFSLDSVAIIPAICCIGSSERNSEVVEEILQCNPHIKSRENKPDASIVVFDIKEKEMFSRELIDICLNNRHYSVLVILTMQETNQIQLFVRNNMDFVFVTSVPSEQERWCIYESYVYGRVSYDNFCEALNICADNQDCLVINTTTNVLRFMRYPTIFKRENAARVIQRGCHNWLFKGRCKDGSVGIVPRLSIESLKREFGMFA